MTPLDHALDLARKAIPVFPCKADKTPHVENGFKSASTDVGQIKYWFARWPDALVSVPTGEASGLFVVDVDSARHQEANDWLERWSPHLPQTRQHITKSGGLHLLFKHRAGLKNTAGKLARGIDTRADGGYICWWPAVGLNVISPDVLADIPEFILLRLLHRPPVLVPPSSSSSRSGRLTSILAAAVKAQEGERNCVTFWCACRINEMLNKGEIESGDAAFAALTDISVNNGLPRREVEQCIASARSRS